MSRRSEFWKELRDLWSNADRFEPELIILITRAQEAAELFGGR